MAPDSPLLLTTAMARTTPTPIIPAPETCTLYGDKWLADIALLLATLYTHHSRASGAHRYALRAVDNPYSPSGKMPIP